MEILAGCMRSSRNATILRARVYLLEDTCMCGVTTVYVIVQLCTFKFVWNVCVGCIVMDDTIICVCACLFNHCFRAKSVKTYMYQYV